jgi:DNA polymerase III delta prime subunit
MQGPNARGVRSSVPVTADEAALELIANSSDGDARRALTALELAAVSASDGHITLEVAKRALAQPYLRYDKNGWVPLRMTRPRAEVSANQCMLCLHLTLLQVKNTST